MLTNIDDTLCEMIGEAPGDGRCLDRTIESTERSIESIQTGQQFWDFLRLKAAADRPKARRFFTPHTDRRKAGLHHDGIFTRLADIGSSWC